MPRVSAAHEQEVRDRILAAAARVFGDKGYHSSTIADVVRESGLSVGAIYSYFSGKDELIRLTCDQIAARGLDELAERLAPATTTRERLAIAIRLYVETIDDYDGAPGQARRPVRFPGGSEDQGALLGSGSAGAAPSGNRLAAWMTTSSVPALAPKWARSGFSTTVSPALMVSTSPASMSTHRSAPSRSSQNGPSP